MRMRQLSGIIESPKQVYQFGKLAMVFSKRSPQDRDHRRKVIFGRKMAYSLDLRKRVVEWVEEGGSVSKASKIYKVGRATIYRWMSRADLKPTKIERRNRKLDWEALRKDVEENPDTKLTELAQKFGVRPSAICYALKKLKITRKKKNYAIEKETDKRESNIIES